MNYDIVIIENQKGEDIMGTLIVLGLVGAFIYVGTGILFDIFFGGK